MADKLAYHYTTVEALHEIVRSKRFRLSNVFFMNDYMEVEWCFNLAREMMEKSPKQFAPLLDQVRERRFKHIFCGCFSAAKDDLSQWRGYADDGRGVAIEVDLTEVAKRSNDHIETFEVIYGVERQNSHLDELLRGFLEPIKKGRLAERLGERGKTAHAYFQLSDFAVQCKNPAFSGEKEIRLVRRAVESKEIWRYDEELAHEFRYGVDFRVRRGTLVPFVEIDLPLDTIRSIWFGPRFGNDMAMVAIQLLLSKEGVSERVVKNIQRSKASYGW